MTTGELYSHSIATYPDVEAVMERPEMPGWFRAYMVQRRRALKTELVEIDTLLALFDNLDQNRLE